LNEGDSPRTAPVGVDYIRIMDAQSRGLLTRCDLSLPCNNLLFPPLAEVLLTTDSQQKYIRQMQTPEEEGAPEAGNEECVNKKMNNR